MAQYAHANFLSRMLAGSQNYSESFKQ